MNPKAKITISSIMACAMFFASVCTCRLNGAEDPAKSRQNDVVESCCSHQATEEAAPVLPSGEACPCCSMHQDSLYVEAAIANAGDMGSGDFVFDAHLLVSVSFERLTLSQPARRTHDPGGHDLATCLALLQSYLA